ncbi:TonB-dependent receptor [Flavobacterium tibetense]|uniref:TonB-dependent receptor n=1 Tax=Flavobacterium tibetense TaxID=2233533 RepID=A0A365P1S8_9FLAO|nr:TonB-dependent receptor [Flavobacterium tibetense]RBA28476.1 TonB-dependent receptor [Flavobacterium tibetense]
MIKKLFVVLLLASSYFATAQNIRLEGIVQDTIGNPLEMANVMVINQETKAMDGYAISNEQGKFQISLKANSTYQIKVSFLGYQPLNIELITGTENIRKVLALKEGGMMLDGVEVVQEMPVTISGDTIIYNADSFKTGTEQKLEDILKKLPGVQVNEDGEIEVEGKRVTQLLVEGKKFFEGDTKIGSKNIPSDAVDKVQVLRNFNEVSQLKGLENNEENIAINIKLKKGKDKFWFGDVLVGGGPDERFVINPKIFYYSPKTTVNVIANFNNIGEVPFSIRDFFRLTGGARNTIARSGTNIGISSNSLGISTTQNNRALEIDSKFGAVNLTNEITKKWNVSGFGVISSNKTITNTNSNFGIFQPNSSELQVIEERTDVSNLRDNLAVFKFGSKYKKNADFQLDYDATVRRSNQTEDNIVNTQSTIFTQSGDIDRTNNIISFKEQDPVAFQQSLNMFWTKDTKNTFVLEVQHLYQDEDPFYNPSLLEDPFPGIGFQSGQSRYDIRQERFVKTNKVDAKADYYYTINNKSILNVTLGNTNSYQTYNSSIFQLLDNGTLYQLPDNGDLIFDNDVQYGFNDAYLGVHYKFTVGKKLTFNPGLNFHQFNIYNDQLNSRVRDDFFRILPDVFAQWQIKKTESLTYNYRMSNFFNDVNTLVEGFTLNNFNSLSAGNRFIDNALQQNHRLNYSKYNLFNYTTIFALLNYTRTTDPVVNRSFFNGISQISERVNGDFSNETVSGTFSYQRSFKKYYKASASTNIAWSKNNQLFVNPSDPANPSSDFSREIENWSQLYRLSFGTQFQKLPNLEAAYNIIINENPNAIFTTHSPSITLDYRIIEGLALTSTYTYNDFRSRDGNVNNTFDLLTASINYRKKDSKLEYRISGTNLLNTKSINSDSFNVVSFNSSQFFVQPRYLIFSLKYNL